MKNLVKVVFLLSALLGACTKTELPPSEMENPLFRADFSLGNESFQMTAGTDNRYMFSSKTYHTNGDFLTFGGTLSDVNCPTGDCPGSLKIELRSATMGNQYVENQSLTTGNKGIANAFMSADTAYLLQLSANGGGDNPSYNWEVGGVAPVAGNTFSHQFPDHTTQYFSLVSTDIEGFVTSIKMPAFLNGTTPCPVPVVTANMEKYTVSVNTQVPSNEASIEWVGGLGVVEQPITSDNQTFVVMVNYLQHPGCLIRVTIDQLPNNPNAVASSPEPFYSVTPIIQAADNRQLGSGSLQFVDNQGLIWSTNAGIPLPNDFIEIEKVENYVNNEKGEPTLKVWMKFNTTFYNQQGISQNMQGSAVIAVER